MIGPFPAAMSDSAIEMCNGDMLVDRDELRLGDIVVADDTSYVERVCPHTGEVFGWNGIGTGRDRVESITGTIVRTVDGAGDERVLDDRRRFWIRARAGQAKVGGKERFPHTCGRCSRPVYIGFNIVEHEANGRMECP